MFLEESPIERSIQPKLGGLTPKRLKLNMMLFTVAKTKNRKTVTTKLLAVRMHADWCESSQNMSRFYEDLKNRFDGQEVLFVTLDYTNNTTKHQASLLANALDIRDAMEPYAGTGHIILMTYQSKSVFGRLSQNLSFMDMVKLIEKKSHSI